MSATLKLFQEAQLKGTWYLYSVPHHVHDINLYALLGLKKHEALVREPVKVKNDLPLDSSPLVRASLQIDSTDAHTANWLDSREVAYISKLHRNIEDQVGYFFGSNWENWHDFPDDKKHLKAVGIQDFRWLYWFVG